jgi:hypothetical protein
LLTIFALPKPFQGRVGTIQRNAIRSWQRLSPDCQVVIFGDETGFRDVKSGFGIDWIPDVERNEFGTPLVSSAFRQADESAGHEVICYANADLIFLPDFVTAIRRVLLAKRRFLLVGQSWNLDVDEELDPEEDGWDTELRRRVAATGVLRARDAIDFFVYRRGTLGLLPDFAVGRPGWDQWTIWRARRLRLPVIDISPSTLVIHQNHAYDHVKAGRGDRWEGPEGDANRALIGDEQYFSMHHATHALTPEGLVPNPTGYRRRLRTELFLHPWGVPLYRGLKRLGL